MNKKNFEGFGRRASDGGANLHRFHQQAAAAAGAVVDRHHTSNDQVSQVIYNPARLALMIKISLPYLIY